MNFSADTTIAYFSMEMCLDEALPTYSGGLGVLAGDTLRSAADLGVPMVAVTLLHRKGYFIQHLDPHGTQTESAVSWQPEDRLEPMAPTVIVEIEGRRVEVRAWRYLVRGSAGHEVPVYLLDTGLPSNSAFDQTITDTLYGGDTHYRICQEAVLGMAGAAMLRALGYEGEIIHHINEGHASLLTVCLLERHLGSRGAWEITESDIEAVRRQCVFTTHTPVPAGHDKFPHDLARQVLGAERMDLLERARALEDGTLNMTLLALRFARYVNAVAMRHQDVSRDMFPGVEIDAITNGVHVGTWTSPAFAELFDRHISGWRHDNLFLRYAGKIPLDEIREAHRDAKLALFAEIERRTSVRLDPVVMTIGFARRATPYKRADLIFTDLDRLKAVTRHVGPLQIVFAGKAHPRDEWGKALIKRIFDASASLGDALRVVYLENYDMRLGHLLTSGVDLWLNNPLRPLEASGTSGMKAALNGVPSASVLDGWWIEGHIEGVTGWSIGRDDPLPQDPSSDVLDLYNKLEQRILPVYYGMPYAWAEIMRHSISLNGSFFNTQRMLMQYVRNAYFPPGALVAIEEVAVL
ncbi:MAG TPA: alpha-glucan family phosphorylase [Gemmatimonadaceae bacterium]|nr:alpha-glucan family phosphorylase [Gemmatimonadaceae bacterium]